MSKIKQLIVILSIIFGGIFMTYAAINYPEILGIILFTLLWILIFALIYITFFND